MLGRVIMIRKDFLIGGFLVLMFFLVPHHITSEIIRFEEGMRREFKLEKYPLVKIFKESYERNNYESAEFSETPLIPKIIHQIWVGGTVPKKFENLMKTWIDKHIGWEYYLWTDDDIDSFEFINKKDFDSAVNKGTKADIWRYEILNSYGGVYVDIDYECLKPLDVIHHTCDFYATITCDDDIIGNGIIGSVKNHPILQDCIKKISRLSKKQLEDPWENTGPKLLTKYIMKHLWKNRNDKTNKTVVYPTLFFHPFPAVYRKEYWKGMIERSFVEDFIIPETFAIHFWATSWQ